MKNSILEQARIISYPGKEADLDNGQQILMTHLSSHPYDTDAWLLLARLECNPPFYDQYRIIHYAQHILSYDPSNAYALLFWSYADYYFLGGSDSELYKALDMAHSEDLEIMSMIELAKARYLKRIGSEKYEKALKKSIKYCSTHVINFHMLGKLYVQQGKIKEGQLLIEHGLKNITELLKCQDVKTWKVDCTSIQGLLDEFFSGISTNDIAIGGW